MWLVKHLAMLALTLWSNIVSQNIRICARIALYRVISLICDNPNRFQKFSFENVICVPKKIKGEIIIWSFATPLQSLKVYDVWFPLSSRCRLATGSRRPTGRAASVPRGHRGHLRQPRRWCHQRLRRYGRTSGQGRSLRNPGWPFRAYVLKAVYRNPSV